MTTKCPPQQQKIWILSDGRMGMRAQCLGLGQALTDHLDLKYPIYDLKISLPRLLAWLPPFWLHKIFWISGGMPLTRFMSFISLLSEHAQKPTHYPDIVISCGRRTIVPTLLLAHAAKKQGHACRTIYLQDPRYGYTDFDLILPPEHDVARNPSLQAKNVIPTKGAIHRINDTVLAQAKETFSTMFKHVQSGPNIALLLGGPNKGYRFPDNLATQWGHMLGKYAHDNEARLLMTASRRTPQSAFLALTTACQAQAKNSYIWDNISPNPYLGMLAWADAIILTNDSINMISEACATGKPVFMLSLEGHYPKFEIFYQNLSQLGLITPITETLPIPQNWGVAKTLNEPQRIAPLIVSYLQA